MQFNIDSLAPLEYKFREESLRFLTEVYRNFGNFDCLIHDIPTVYEINGIEYLVAGNHRAIWNLINGIQDLDCQVEIPSELEKKITLSTAQSVQKRGIFSFRDFVEKIKDPSNYSRHGTPKIILDPTSFKDRMFYLPI